MGKPQPPIMVKESKNGRKRQTLLTSPSVLVITHSKIAQKGVEVFAWSDQIPNIADYDLVIFDLVTLRDYLKVSALSFVVQLKITQEKVSELLWSNGKVVCIAPPEGLVKIGQRSIPLLWWSPVPIAILPDEGKNIRVLNDSYQRYFSQGVSRYRSKFILPRANFVPSYECALEPAVTSRSGVVLAGEAIMTKISDIFGALMKGAKSGPIVLLPEPDRISVGEAIQIIFQDILGLTSKTPPPEWVDRFTLPSLEGELSRLNILVEQRNSLDEKIQKHKSELEELQSCKRLLFEDGTELEAAVWDSLEKLGATMHHAEISGREDSWFESPTGKDKGAIEVKGHIGSMTTDDARQADDWVSDLLARKGKEMKGILFGNPYRSKPPEQRPSPWPQDVVRYANQRGLALMTTVGLFDVLVKVEVGELKPSDFFKALFENNGPVAF